MSAIIEKMSLKIHATGHQKNNIDAVCDTRTIDDYELIYNIGGTSIITINSTKHILTKGDIIIIPPFVSHKIDTEKNSLHDNYWLHFNMNFGGDELVNSLIKKWNGYSNHIGTDTELLSLYNSLEKENTQNSPCSYSVMNSVLTQLIAYIIRKYEINSADFTRQIKSEFFMKTYDFINLNINSIKTVSDVCDKMNISISYCNKLFRENLNCSPAKYIVQLKLKEATNQLKYSEKSVLEISDTLNFANPFHFSNTFKKYYGESPSQYRKNNFNC